MVCIVAIIKRGCSQWHVIIEESFQLGMPSSSQPNFSAAKEKIKLVHVAYRGVAPQFSIWWPVTSRSAA
jgi:hypothetical protein